MEEVKPSKPVLFYFCLFCLGEGCVCVAGRGSSVCDGGGRGQGKSHENM